MHTLVLMHQAARAETAGSTTRRHIIATPVRPATKQSV